MFAQSKPFPAILGLFSELKAGYGLKIAAESSERERTHGVCGTIKKVVLFLPAGISSRLIISRL
jgi:hypothetical protein